MAKPPNILDFSEEGSVEQPSIALFASLGWQTMNCYHEFARGQSKLGRDNKGDVVLVSRLRPALKKLNPSLPDEAITGAIEELTRDRSAMSAVAANREVYQLLKNGVKATYRGQDADAEEVTETVSVIDWKTPANNDFFLASQFWMTGEMYTRRADLVGFVNGLPLVFLELKASHKNVKNAYDHNLKDYRNAIPKLFWYNAFIILSNGSQSVIGSISARWEHFADWKRINSEGEQGIISLDTIIQGTCNKTRLLDITENFTLFQQVRGGMVKLTCKNHQYLGVNSAIEGLEHIEASQGKLGVFWHTQGSGKSVSMIFFAQKVLRKLPGNWTFLIVTDRQELDDQIYKNFADAGIVTETQAQATSADHLRRLLTEDHRFVFTLIHKFRTDKGMAYPKLTDRKDIIVITDEAHRSQYTTLAMNMRNALPNAAFIAFTGTPLIVGEEKTKDVFGDYVSIYDFKQSVDDGATVPLYYENRIPELQLTNENLNEAMEDLLEEAMLDEEQEQKLEREFSREYHLITRDDRLEKIAEDLIQHFASRGFKGKAMVISIDKATAVKMYDKVKKHRQTYLARLKDGLRVATGDQKAEIEATITFLETTDMAVIVSQAQNEIEDLKEKGADITAHRKRLKTEDLEEKFKNPDDPLRLVFVCAMWMTGFDVPSCSTIYLDKPMRNHTLMQTIARANRVFPDKLNGLIVDYVGVFRDLQKALAIYGSGGGAEEGKTPARSKAELVDLLRQAITSAVTFCTERGIDFQKILNATGFEKIRQIDDAVEAIIVNDEVKKQFSVLCNDVVRLFKAILPDPSANEFLQTRMILEVLASKIGALTPKADISDVIGDLEKLLDESVAAEGYIIHETDPTRLVDLSQIDFETLKDKFLKGRKRTEMEKLRAGVQKKLTQMVRLNRTRLDYLEKYQQMIEEYNAGSVNIEEQFNRLVEFARALTQEEQRTISEELTEEELALFDLLTKPDLALSEKDQKQVKKVASELLQTLKKEKLVLDWRKKQDMRAAVKLCIEERLDHLPEAFSTELYQQKCDQAYQHVYESYFGGGSSIYAA